jgi:hypothetical protein
VSYQKARWLANGKELLATGVEAGHGVRDYLIDVSNGNSKPVTPEGVVGVNPSLDGRRTVVQEPDGKLAVWSLEEGNSREIPGLDSKYRVSGWSPDGNSIYVSTIRQREKTAVIQRVNVDTGKIEPWKTVGGELPVGATTFGWSYYPGDNGSYAYLYDQVLSQAYVVRNLR